MEQIGSLLRQQKDAKLKLIFDSAGCGCGVNGIPSLCITHGAGKKADRTAEGPLPILYDRNDEIYFEDRMQLDYSPNSRALCLKSSSQIYNSHIQIKEC